MGWRSLGLAAGFAVATATAGCTNGTTPDCSDAQCRVLDAVEGGGDAEAADGAADASSAGPDAKSEMDAGEAGPASTVTPEAGSHDAGPSADAAADAASNPSDAASHPPDAGDSG
jgi:hypothetical protein